MDLRNPRTPFADDAAVAAARGVEPQSKSQPPLQSRTAPRDAAHRWHSADLFGAAREVEIEHGAAVYRLRLTSLGKLILTK